MSILSKLTTINLKQNKRRTLVTILGIIISCALIFGVITLLLSFQDFLIEAERKSNGDYNIIYEDIQYDNLKYISNNTKVQDYSYVKELGYAKLESGINDYKPYLYIRAFDKKSLERYYIKAIKGRLPNNDSEIVISNHIITNGGVNYQVGDKLTLNIGKRVLENDGVKETGNQNTPYNIIETLEIEQQKEFTIVGIIERPMSEGYSAPGYTVITRLNDNDIKIGNSFTLLINLKKPKEAYDLGESLLKKSGYPKELNERNSNYPISYNRNLLAYYGASDTYDMTSFFTSVGAIVIGLVVISSVIVIYNSFSISVTERKRQIGMLSSVGSTPSQVRNMVFTEGFIIGLIAIPLGLLGAILGIWCVLTFINSLDIFEMIGSKFRLVLNAPGIILGIIIMLITIMISALIPALKASRITPIEAIRSSGDIKIKKKKVRTSKLSRILFGIEGDIARKNLKRSKGKYRTTIISLVISIVLFIGFNSFINYGFSTVNSVHGNINYNIIVDTGISSKETDDYYNKIIKLDNIKSYNKIRSLNMTTYLEKSDFSQTVVDNLLPLLYKTDQGDYEVRVYLNSIDNEVLKEYTKELGLKYEEFIDVNNPKGIVLKNKIIFNKSYEFNILNSKTNKIKLGGNNSYDESAKRTTLTSEIELTKAVDKYTTGLGIHQSMSIMIVVSDTVFDKMEEAAGETNNKALTIDSNNASKLENDIKSLKGEDTFSNLTILNLNEAVDTMNQVILVISIFLYGFITLITMIGVTNIFNTITTNIALRKREFATLKSIGMTTNSFNKMIVYESFFYGLKACIYGIPLGIIVSYLMYKGFGSIYDSGYIIPLTPIIIAIIGVFVIVFTTMVYSVRKVNKQNIIDVIREENI